MQPHTSFVGQSFPPLTRHRAWWIPTVVRAIGYVGQRVETRSQHANPRSRPTLQSKGEAEAIYHFRVSLRNPYNAQMSILNKLGGLSSCPNCSRATVLKQ